MTLSQAVWAFLNAFGVLVLGYFILLNGGYLITSLVAFVSLRRYARRLRIMPIEDLITAAGAPPITLIVPAHNEEATCAAAVRSLLSLRYPDYEILVVNDGSTDGTLRNLAAVFDMVPAARIPTAELPTAAVHRVTRSRRHPRLWVLDKEHGGKADALNAGLNFCRSPLFCMMDADTLLEREALTRIVRPFLEDARTVAAGGIIRIANGCAVKDGVVADVRLPRGLLARFQVLEYLRAFLASRMGWNALGGTLIIAGAFGLLRRRAVIDAGGFSPDAVGGEDMELIVRLHRHCRERGIPYRISYVPDPVAWTEVPETVADLGRQRDRWQRGLMGAMAFHRRMLFNPRYGVVGMLAMPFYYLLELFGPVIELCGYLLFLAALAAGKIPPLYALAFLAVSVVFGMILSTAAVVLEESSFQRYPRFRDLLQLFALAMLENFGYRQLTTVWRVRGMLAFPRGPGAGSWEALPRKGFDMAGAR